MQESITVIEKAIQGKKEFVRQLNNEREILIEALSDNFSNRISTEKKIIELERNLKDIYDMTYHKKDSCKKNVYDGMIPNEALSERENGISEHSYKPSY